MRQVIRAFDVDSVTVTTSETFWAAPVDVVHVDVQPLDTTLTNRMSFVAGGTADGGKYTPLDPDWWTPDGTKLVQGTKIYFRSSGAGTVFKVLYGIGS